jgi:hypothetical protein
MENCIIFLVEEFVSCRDRSVFCFGGENEKALFVCDKPGTGIFPGNSIGVGPGH